MYKQYLFMAKGGYSLHHITLTYTYIYSNTCTTNMPAFEDFLGSNDMKAKCLYAKSIAISITSLARIATQEFVSITHKLGSV